MGQPLHAFDLQYLREDTLRIRSARAGETIVRLDGVTSQLDEKMLVIADAQQAVAVAGVMGGQETGVSDRTVDILLESATFLPSSVRRTSKVLGISTDSSYRFERGVDVELAPKASVRATALILEICGGKLAGGLTDLHPHPTSSRTIPLRWERVSSLLGAPMPLDFAEGIMTRMGCTVKSTPTSAQVNPPSWRPDLEREIDLIEEVGRVFGIDKIPSTMKSASLSTTRDSLPYLLAQKIRQLACSQGLDEVQNYPLISSQHVREAQPHVMIEKLILANPLNSEMDSLRPSLIYGLLDTAARNLAAGNQGVALFELGKIFDTQNDLVFEKWSLGILVAGLQSAGASWEKGVHGKLFDFFDLKGMVEEILRQVDASVLSPCEASPHPSPLIEPGIGWSISRGNQNLAFAGKVTSRLTRKFKLTPETFFAEFDVEPLFPPAKGFANYQPWSVYPGIRRDIAITVPLDFKHAPVDIALRRLAQKHMDSKGIILQDVQLYDRFISEKIGEGKKSLAYSMIYRSPTRTLTDGEINQIHETVKKDLASEIICEIRDHT
jgi:phenylalanyl-tRNA synthetase beta chain